MLSANVRLPETKYKRSKIALSVTAIAFTVVNICTELLQLPAQPLIWSPGTLVPLQPIPLGVTSLNAVSKLKAHSSNVSFH